ncbi:MAG: hypothetical protein JSW73_04915 [Candidatus Woesearchaeota archaeon]|nr:MAG: hypothetical protein JSW73_04915 [Candidatus Woesearchaeota archaeon]
MNDRGEIGVGTVALVILAVIFLASIAYWATGHVIPVMGEKVQEAEEWVEGVALECNDMPIIDADECAEAGIKDCKQSDDIDDYSTYAVRIPVETEYWVDVNISVDETWADDPAHRDTNHAHACSFNDPDEYPPHEYRPLIFEFSIGDAVGTYEVSPDTPDGTELNVSIYLGVVDPGNNNLRWRIVTDWHDVGAADPDCNAADDLPLDPFGDVNRQGYLAEDKIKIYCELFEGEE